MSDPHVREYLAAAEGMADVYGGTPYPPATRMPRVGEICSGRTAGRRWQGEVVAVFAAAGTLDVEVAGAWLASVPIQDLDD